MGILMMKEYVRMYIKKNKELWIITLIALIIRLLCIPIPAFKIDMDAWVAWSYRLVDGGLASFYSPEVWTNYTPGYLYILWLLGIIRIIFSFDQEIVVMLIKLVSIFSELALAILVYFKITPQLNQKLKLILVGLLLFNPALIFNSAVWGQIDGILTLFLILSVYFLTQKEQEQKASLSYSYSFLIKPQSLALGPLFLIHVLKHKTFNNIKNILFFGTLLFFFLSFPFFITDPLLGIFKLIFQMAQDYPATSLFAYNFWGIEGFWLDDLRNVGPLSMRTVGTIVYVGFIIGVLFLGVKKKANYYAVAALLALAFYFLPTRVHERYLYPAIPLLFIYASLIKNKILTALTLTLSLLYFLSEYYVYVYYNELYLKLEKVLYNDALYTFLDTNGKLLSLTSSLIFIIIVWLIIKSIYDKKNSKI